MNEVIDFFTNLFEHSDFRSLWQSGSWTKFHGWLYIISDLLVWSAYFVIPILIMIFWARKYKRINFRALYFMFAGFILVSGATYFIDAMMFWVPVYRVSALMRLITGIISWITVFYVVKMLPVAFSLKSPKELQVEIDQRKQMEAELQQMNYQLVEAEKMANLCYMQWDIVNEKIDLSAGAEKIFDLPLDFCLNYNNLLDLIHPDDMKFMEKMMDTIFIKRIFPDFYVRIITRMDELKHILVRGEIVIEDGAIKMLRGTLQDVTELVLYMQKVEMQNQQLKQIAWIQSHKVRSPVASILGLVQLFNPEDPADDTNKQVINGLKEAAANLDEVIKEINTNTEKIEFE